MSQKIKMSLALIKARGSQNHNLINKEGQISLQMAPGLRFEVQDVAGIEVALAIEEQKAAV